MVYSQTRISHGKWEANITWNFRIQTDHVVPARRPDLVIVNRKKKKNENLPKTKKKKEKYLGLAKKKLWKMKMTVIPIVISALGKIPMCLETGGFTNQRENWDHTNNIIVDVGQNTEKIPDD